MKERYKNQRYLFISEPPPYSYSPSPITTFWPPRMGLYEEYLYTLYDQDIFTGEYITKYNYHQQYLERKPIKKYKFNMLDKAIWSLLGFY